MTRADLRRVLVAYDIPSDARRTRIANLLSSYGDRIQYSVFLVDAAPVRIARMTRRLEAMMIDGEDSVLVCDLGLIGGAELRIIELGRRRPTTDAGSFIV